MNVFGCFASCFNVKKLVVVTRSSVAIDTVAHKCETIIISQRKVAANSKEDACLSTIYQRGVVHGQLQSLLTLLDGI